MHPILLGLTLSVIVGILPIDSKSACPDTERLQSLERQLMQTVEIARKIEDNEHRANALVGIAGVFAQAGQSWCAFELVDEALKSAEKIEPDRYRLWALWEVAKGCANIGQRWHTIAAAEQALKTAERIQEGYQDHTIMLFDMAVVFAEVGQWARAVEVAERALQNAKLPEDKWNLSKILQQTLAVFLKAGESEKALALIGKIEKIEGEEDRADILSEALAHVAGVCTPEQAVAVAEKALNIAESIGDHKRRAYVLKEIAVVFARAGEVEKATKIAENIEELLKIKESANKATKSSDDTAHERLCISTWAGIAIALVEADMIAEAIKTAETILEKYKNDHGALEKSHKRLQKREMRRRF